MVPPGIMEPTVKYHPRDVETLTKTSEAWSGTTAGGQFDWGGRLPKSNGGAQRYPQAEWKPAVECKSIRVLNCKTDMSRRCESRF